MKRNKPLKRTAFKKRTAKPRNASRRPKIARRREKLPKPSTMRNKCDKLLTPIIKLMHPYCLLQAPNCSRVTQVAHHHVHKSKSSRLRYEIDNLIPLCHHCHVVLHQNESYWAGIIIQKRGMEWFEKLRVTGEEIVKTDVHWYVDNHARLREILYNLEN